jgi:arylformamidase
MDTHQVNVTHLSMTAHAGTHVDAPLHFLPHGDSVEKLPLDSLIGPALVVQCTGRPVPLDQVQALELCEAPRVLFKTGALPDGEFREFDRGFAALDIAAARWLAASGVKLVGIDTPSVQLFSDHDPAVHVALLEAGIVVVENLDLAHVSPGRYVLHCLPLKLEGAEGSPARAVLTEV